MAAVSFSFEATAGSWAKCWSLFRKVDPRVRSFQIGVTEGVLVPGLSTESYDVFHLNKNGQGHNRIYRVVPRNGEVPYIRKQYPDFWQMRESDFYGLKELKRIAARLPEFFRIPEVTRDPEHSDSLRLSDTRGRPLFDILLDPNCPRAVKRKLVELHNKNMRSLKRYIDTSREYRIVVSRLDFNEEVGTFDGSYLLYRNGRRYDFFVKDLDVVVSQLPSGKLVLSLVDSL